MFAHAYAVRVGNLCHIMLVLRHAICCHGHIAKLQLFRMRLEPFLQNLEE